MMIDYYRSFYTKVAFLLFIGFQLAACGTTDNPAADISCLSPSGVSQDCGVDIPVDPGVTPDPANDPGNDPGSDPGNDPGADPGTDPGNPPPPPPPPATASLTVSWVAPSARADGAGLSLSEIAGYRIYYGSSQGNYANTIAINNSSATQRTLTNLATGRTYYIVMTTVDTAGRESAYSQVYTASL